MPKYWGKQIFTHGRFPRSGSKAKDGDRKKERKKRPNDGNNNGQAMHGARKLAWRTQAAWANFSSKILDEKLFRTREIPRSGSKAEDGEKREKREKDRMMVITMAKLCMAHASTHGARKPPGPINPREACRTLLKESFISLL